MLLSVIIPVYNSEKTLKRCVDSLLNQDFQDVEIILINDGSTDDSAEICKEYKEKDIRVVYIDKPNGGVSSARNAGLKVAKGEYILFVDSDDYVLDNYFSVIEEIISKKCDYAIFSVVINNGNISREKRLYNFFSKDIEQFLPKIIYSITHKQINGPVNKIYRKKILDDNNILFNENLSIAEDWLFNLLYIYHIDSFVTTSDILYCVNTENSNSLSRKIRSDIKEQLSFAFVESEKLLENSKLEEKYKKQYIASFNFLKYADIYSEAKRLRIRKLPFFKRIKIIKKYCKEVNAKMLMIPSDKRSRLLSLPVRLNLYVLIDLAGWYLSR